MGHKQTFQHVVVWALLTSLLALVRGRPADDGGARFYRQTDSSEPLQTGERTASMHMRELKAKRLMGALVQQLQPPSGGVQDGHGQGGSNGNGVNLGNSNSGGSGNSKPETAGQGGSNGNGVNLGNSNSGGSGNGKLETAGGSEEGLCPGNAPQCTGGNAAVGGKAAGPLPRGNDPRSRAWGSLNSRGEVAYDDRKSPRTVAFLGRSANVRIYPNFSDPSVFLQLRFGKIQELDATGKPVSGHSVPSLAATTNVTFAAGNTTVNGVNMSYVNFTLNPLDLNGFILSCNGDDDEGRGDADGSNDSSTSPLPASSPAAGVRRLQSLFVGAAPTSSSPPHVAGGRRLQLSLLSATPASSSPPNPVYDGGDAGNPQLTLTLFFGLDDALTLPYGDVDITVPRNGLKWSISYRNWPFCNTSNTLSVSLNLLVANNASAQIASTDGTRQLEITLGSDYNATLGFLDYALDGAAAADSATATTSASSSASAVNATRMPVNVSLGTDDGGVTTVLMGLPNPAAYNVTSGAVWYDPTQTTTTIYLAVNDPGNSGAKLQTVVVQQTSLNVTAVGQIGSDSDRTGAAAAMRTALWTAVAALLLAVFVSGSW